MAFCPNCGTKAGDGAAFCTECGTSLNTHNSGAQKHQTDGAYGLGGAITSVILGFPGFVFSIIAFIMGVSAAESRADEPAIAAMVIGFVMGVICFVALRLGTKAKGNSEKGVALETRSKGAFVVGTIGTVLSGLGLLFAILGFAIGAMSF